MMTHNETREIEILDKLPTKLDWSIKAIKADKAWKKTKGEGVKVLVIDTGMDENHPELKGKVKYGINMFEKTNDITDEYGHGTHVAGLIAGNKTGVAPNVDLYIAKVLDSSGAGSMASVMDGITLAINFKVDVLCMSLGIRGGLPVQLEQRILDAHAKGVNIVCAVGNMGLPEVDYPSFMDEVIGVGGVDKDLNHASFSNRGANSGSRKGLDFVAPSVDVLSAYKDGKYAKLTGTSMSAPLIAGIMALIISYYRKKGVELTTHELKDLMIQNSTNDGWNVNTGWGIPDVSKILRSDIQDNK